MLSDMGKQAREYLPWAGAIPDSELEKLFSRLEARSVSKHEFFIRAGDKPCILGVIVSGLFRTFCVTDSGDEKIQAFRQEGQILGGYAPYLINQDIWYSIQALEDSELLCFTFQDLEELSMGHPSWEKSINEYTKNLFIEKECRERSLLMDNATSRYLAFLQDHPTLEGRVSQYHIASYLGITPVSLSRIRASLK